MATPLKAGQSILGQIGESNFSGWMHKRSDRYISWKQRYFVLKGPHLYWLRSSSKTETELKGYVNVIGYKVIAGENLNPRRYRFKISHERDKTHFFSSDQLTVVREWMRAIRKATIQRDFSIPVRSTSNIPTISLAVAQATSSAPRSPSPKARYAMLNLLHVKPNNSSSRDLRALPVPPGKLKATGPSILIPESLSPDSETSRELPSPDSEALSQQSTITIVPALRISPKLKYPRKPRTPSPESPRITYVQPLQPPPSRSPSRIAVDKPLHLKASKSEPRTVMQYDEVDDRGRRRDRRPVPRFEETIRNDTDPHYTRRQHSDRWSIERAGVLTIIDTGDWPDTPSSPVYIVSTPRRSISLHTTFGATTDANDVRMTIPRRSSSVRHSSASSIIVPGTAAESRLSLSSRTTMSARIGSMLGLRANPSLRSSIAS